MSSNTIELLQRQEDAFRRQTEWNCRWSAELEFYLKGAVDTKALSDQLDIAIEEEKGESQYEIKLPIYNSAVELVGAVTTLKERILDVAQKYHIEVIYQAKPYKNQPGSGLHINVNISDNDSNNLCMKAGRDKESQIMQYAVAGLLESMEYMMPIFAPTKESHGRYVPQTEAPCFIAWGGNNRTVALRIPTTTHNEETRHIEHRVPGMDSKIEDVLLAIYRGIHYGVTYKIRPRQPKVYGNAYDKEYQNPPYKLKSLFGITQQEA